MFNARIDIYMKKLLYYYFWFAIYFSDYEIKISEEPEIIYSIRDNLMSINFGKERSDREMQYLYDNNAIELTNIGGYTIFKFPETINKKE